jgi:predicted acylesterase/phospholipase RssA
MSESLIADPPSTEHIVDKKPPAPPRPEGTKGPLHGSAKLLEDLKMVKGHAKNALSFIIGYKEKGSLSQEQKEIEEKEALIGFVKEVGQQGTAMDQLAALAYETNPQEPGREKKIKLIQKLNKLAQKVCKEKEAKPTPLEIKAYGSRETLDLLFNRDRQATADRKVVMMMPGGGSGGVMGAGILEGLIQADALQNVDEVWGASVGSTTLPFLATGETAQAPTLYEQLPTSPDFIKLPLHSPIETVRALWNLYKNGPTHAIVDTGFIGQKLREILGSKVDQIAEYPIPLNVLVMDTKTGKPRKIDIRELTDPISAIDGSICIPGVSSQACIPIDHKGERIDAADGDYAATLGQAAELAFADGATDVVIVANFPLEKNGFAADIQSEVMKLLARGYSYNEAVQKTISEHDEWWNDSLDSLKAIMKQKNPQQRVVIIGPAKGGLSPLEKDPKQFRRIYEEAKQGSESIAKVWKKPT